MSARAYSEVVQTARDYYNSDDADNFYFHIWGGEDIHIGLYESSDEPIAQASRRTVAHMADQLGPLTADHRVLDLGAGYGGSMRYLAKKFGCQCVALNLSEVENERNRQMNREQGLDERIKVVDGDFTRLGFGDGEFDVVWSQDAFLHSGERERVCAEAARVLKPGGKLIFTDPMQADDAPTDRLQPIYDRLHLKSLGSPGFYRSTLTGLGLEKCRVRRPQRFNFRATTPAFANNSSPTPANCSKMASARTTLNGCNPASSTGSTAATRTSWPGASSPPNDRAEFCKPPKTPKPPKKVFLSFGVFGVFGGSRVSGQNFQ